MPAMIAVLSMGFMAGSSGTTTRWSGRLRARFPMSAAGTPPTSMVIAARLPTSCDGGPSRTSSVAPSDPVETAGIARPVTPAEAKFSIAFTVATMLVHGGVDLASFTEARVTDPAITELLGRVHPKATAEFTDPFPRRRGARVTIHLVDGTTLEVAVPDRFGSPENPMSPEQLERKFRDLVARSRTPIDAEVLLDQLMHLADVEALRTLVV